ncbi:MAG: hemolysin, partial [Muribaculaceae bacterium]|nr:hemolysin [Muribaculaceae bacterium]
RYCRNMILYFMNKHFPDDQKLVTPIKALNTNTDEEEMARLFVGETFKEDYKIMNQAIRQFGINIPPLVNAYMNLSPTMKIFGTAVNDDFGDVEETGIFLAIDEIVEEKKQRHIGTFVQPKMKISND